MIWYFTPSCIDKNLGKSYNDYCKLITNEDDWIVMMDRDTLLLTPNYLRIIAETINEHKEIGLFTCRTNRTKNKQQQYNNEISGETNILEHYYIAERLEKEKSNQLTELKKFISGYIMIFKKSTWTKVNGFSEGIIGVDNRFSHRILKANMKVMIIESLYIFHYYRLHTNVKDKSHLRPVEPKDRILTGGR